MATNGNGTRNGNGRNDNANGRNGKGAPVVTMTVRPATAADHAAAARDFGKMAVHHAAQAARLAKQPRNTR